jgi:ABC-2 type transport system ATP-binding protein
LQAEAGPAPSADRILPKSPRVELFTVDRAFGERLVVSNVSLTVNEGEIFGIVGPSGCGKTTVVRMIVGLLSPSSGEVLVNGVNPEKFKPKDKARLGYMPQTFSLYPSLTTLENARFMSSLYGIGWLARGKRIREVLEFLELWDARNRLASNLSGGMQRRLSLTCAILHRPSLIVVDEPTAGLDPALRARIWDYMHELRARGSTIIFTTQYIEEAERCDSVAILNQGAIAAMGSPQELRTEAGIPDEITLDLVSGDPPAAIAELRTLPGVRDLRWDGTRSLALFVDDFVSALPRVERICRSHGCETSNVSTRQATFEDVFMRLTRSSAA